MDALGQLAPGNDYSRVPYTPEACCKGRTQEDFPIYLPRFGQSINLYRPQMSCDIIGCPDMFWSHGNVFCYFLTPDTGIPPDWNKFLSMHSRDDSELEHAHCLLEVRYGVQRSRETARSDKCLFLSIGSPIARDDVIWALEMAAKWGAQHRRQLTGKDFAIAAAARKSPIASEKCITS